MPFAEVSVTLNNDSVLRNILRKNICLSKNPTPKKFNRKFLATGNAATVGNLQSVRARLEGRNPPKAPVPNVYHIQEFNVENDTANKKNIDSQKRLKAQSAVSPLEDIVCDDLPISQWPRARKQRMQVEEGELLRTRKHTAASALLGLSHYR
ncbi:unnamed protein product [Chondrus crispus]|uniref:Uncharacterized protein n=1 Tax=Chondrus crispus TaxID=2769 RepID=R7Q5R8_CHOCR|nr:unnamed protein product [Chondrus crispus]CDF32810.1 unnamed protein product [Chondrus crispus]|eukprot:XP_005712611.1 unnamed protein product [Chondrus crispus]